MRPFGPGRSRAQPLRSPCSFQPASPRPGSASVLRLGHELSSFALRVAMPPRFMNPLLLGTWLSLIGCASPQTGVRQPPPVTHPEASTAAVQPSQSIEQIPFKWLNYRTTIDTAERDNMRGGPDLDFKPIAFGHLHRQWTVFKAQLRSGDELWHWTSGPRFGYCIVRNRQTVALFTYHDLGK